MEVMPTVADLPKTTTVWPDPVARRARLNAEVARLLDVLDRHDHDHADIDQVWLIGSTVDADADVRSTSDIDLVVVQRTAESVVDRGLSLRRELAATEPLDLFVYTPAEFGRAERFVEHVRRHGSRVR